MKIKDSYEGKNIEVCKVIVRPAVENLHIICTVKTKHTNTYRNRETLQLINKREKCTTEQPLLMRLILLNIYLPQYSIGDNRISYKDDSTNVDDLQQFTGLLCTLLCLQDIEK